MTLQKTLFYLFQTSGFEGLTTFFRHCKNNHLRKNGEYLTVEQVPHHYREKFIHTGYRHPHSSAFQCVSSALHLNNETLNIWTHLLPFFILFIYFYLRFPTSLWPVSEIPVQFYPLVTMEISVLIYHLGSTGAHTFNCMTPRIRHVCFYVDYAAISMFSIGGSCATFFYLRPLVHSKFFLYNYPNLYTGGVVIVTLIQLFINCASRHSWTAHKYTIRTIVFAVVFIYGNFPNLHRGFICALGGEEDCPASLSIFVTGYIFYFISAILNVSRVPERYFPCMFDIVGHNHQWLHIITTLGTVSHIWTVELELDARKNAFPLLLKGLSTWNTLGCMCITIIISMAMACWFRSRLNNEGHLKAF